MNSKSLTKKPIVPALLVLALSTLRVFWRKTATFCVHRVGSRSLSLAKWGDSARFQRRIQVQEWSSSGGIVMKSKQICRWVTGVSLLCGLPLLLYAQEPRPASERPASSGRDMETGPTSFAVNGSISREAQAAAPRVLKISGVLLDASAKPVNGEVEVTFALYKQEGDEEPLWTE